MLLKMLRKIWPTNGAVPVISPEYSSPKYDESVDDVPYFVIFHMAAGYDRFLKLVAGRRYHCKFCNSLLSKGFDFDYCRNKHCAIQWKPQD